MILECYFILKLDNSMFIWFALLGSEYSHSGFRGCENVQKCYSKSVWNGKDANADSCHLKMIEIHDGKFHEFYLIWIWQI